MNDASAVSVNKSGERKGSSEVAADVIQRHISRDELAAETNPSLLAALATAVHHAPDREHTARRFKAAVNATLPFVRYRFVLAFAALVDRGFISDPSRRCIVVGFAARADGGRLAARPSHLAFAPRSHASIGTSPLSRSPRWSIALERWSPHDVSARWCWEALRLARCCSRQSVSTVF
jgi:hypothetical protein